jgi:hypothetical protein
VKQFAVIAYGSGGGGLTQSHRCFEYRVEHRRKIAGRAFDDLKDLGRRGLLFACLVQLGGQPADRLLHRLSARQ